MKTLGKLLANLSFFEPGVRQTELDFQRDYEIQTLKSEKIRLLILAGFFGAMFGFSGLAILAFPGSIANYMGDIHNAARLTVFFGLAFGLILFIRLAFGYFEKKSYLPKWFPFVNVLVEMTIPTFGLAVMLNFGPPEFALAGPPLIVYGIFIMLSILRLNWKLSLFSGFCAALGYMLLAIVTVKEPQIINGVHKYFFSLALHGGRAGLLMFSGGISAYISYRISFQTITSLKHARDMNILKNMFGEHLSPAVVEKLMENGNVANEKMDVTILFLDIRGFTAFSENKSPDEVFSFLNSSFEWMIDIIHSNDGYVNKFLGDGFLAVFGAPVQDNNHAQKALDASLGIMQALENKIKSGEIEPFKIGIGIHSGESAVGTVGGAGKLEYTVIGDTVNLASRVEQLTKQHSVTCLVTGDLVARLSRKNEIPLEMVGDINIRGRVKSVDIHSVVAVNA